MRGGQKSCDDNCPKERVTTTEESNMNDEKWIYYADKVIDYAVGFVVGCLFILIVTSWGV